MRNRYLQRGINTLGVIFCAAICIAATYAFYYGMDVVLLEIKSFPTKIPSSLLRWIFGWKVLIAADCGLHILLLFVWFFVLGSRADGNDTSISTGYSWFVWAKKVIRNAFVWPLFLLSIMAGACELSMGTQYGFLAKTVLAGLCCLHVWRSVDLFLRLRCTLFWANDKQCGIDSGVFPWQKGTLVWNYDEPPALSHDGYYFAHAPVSGFLGWTFQHGTLLIHGRKFEYVEQRDLYFLYISQFFEKYRPANWRTLYGGR